MQTESSAPTPMLTNRSNSLGSFRLSIVKRQQDNLLFNPSLSALRNIIIVPKEMYKEFNQFALTQSRLTEIPEYTKLTEQITQFNGELRRYKDTKENFEIRNIRLTYHLYENLYTRLKYICNLSTDRESASKSLCQVMKWFMEQKPKVRGAHPKQSEPSVKQIQENKKETERQKHFTQMASLRRQLMPYQKMARTAHAEFFPPKQRLLDYRKKQFNWEGETESETQTEGVRDLEYQAQIQMNTQSKRISRTAAGRSNKRFPLLNQQKKKSVGSTAMRTTMATTMRGTRNSFNRNSSGVGINDNGNDADVDEIRQFNIGNQEQLAIDEGGEVASQEENSAGDTKKQDIANQLIEQPQYQEDQVDGNQKDILAESGSEQNQQNEMGIAIKEKKGKAKSKSKYRTFKQQQVYKQEFIAQQLAIAQERIKAQKQSTLRMLLKSKESQIQNKLQDLENMKKNMAKWRKGKASLVTQSNQRGQSTVYANTYDRLQYKRVKCVEKTTSKKSVKMTVLDANDNNFNEFYSARSRTSDPVTKHSPSLQSAHEKGKITSTMKRYGRYIDSHVAGQKKKNQTKAKINGSLSARNQQANDQFDDNDFQNQENLENSLEEERQAKALRQKENQKNEQQQRQQRQERQEQIRLMRATSLTCFNRKNQTKKLPFSELLKRNSPNLYNASAQDDTIFIKNRLAKKSVSLNGKKVFKALNVIGYDQRALREVEEQLNLNLNGNSDANGNLTGKRIFSKTINLPSNPYFPKPSTAKKKKKFSEFA